MKLIKRPVIRRPSVPVRMPGIPMYRTATMIPTGMNEHDQDFYEGYRTADLIPSGMHGTEMSTAAKQVVASMVKKGVHPRRARQLVHRAAGRVRRFRPRSSGLNDLGDVVADGMTWVTYGNDIFRRSQTGDVSAEAMKAVQNINTFLGNRGEELEAVSHDTVDAIDQTADRLTKLATGKIHYDSVAAAFFDELGNAIRGEVIVGTNAVLDAPKKIVKFVGNEVIKPAIDIVPWYVWAGIVLGGGAVAGKALKLF
jgi:hypothetical protein